MRASTAKCPQACAHGQSQKHTIAEIIQTGVRESNSSARLAADTISSDVHQLCINGPAYDQVTTMSKFLCIGMELNDVIAASTVNAGMALKRPELGSLKPGSVGDATILKVKEGRFDYVDVVGEHLEGDRKIASEGVVVAGRWWHPKEG